MTYQILKNLKTYKFKALLLSCIFCFGIWADEKESKNTSKVSSTKYSVRDSVWMLSKGGISGTGFFIAPNKFITNFHVIEGLSQSTPTLEEITLLQAGHNKTLKIKGILALSALHDLALLEIKDPVDHYLSIRQKPLQEKENLFITGYPNGKLTDMRKINENTLFLENDISFFINMPPKLGGASGSPIVDADKQVSGVLYHSKLKHNLCFSPKIEDLKDFIHIGLKNTPQNNLKQLIENEMENLRNLAERDNIKAQYQLGLMYYYGKRVDQSYKDAFYWFRSAAKQGDVKAQHQVGLMYYYGKGVNQSYKEAFRFYKLAAEQYYVSGQYQLGLMYYYGQGIDQKNYKKAFRLFEALAEQGDARATYQLAWMYYKGEGVVQNYKTAFHLFELAAKQGDAKATYKLAWMYYKGEEVVQNYKTAFHLFESIATQGYTKAAYMLGVMYYNGEGIPRSHKQAALWFEIVAPQGYTKVAYILGLMYYQGKEMDRDDEKARHWFQLAAEKGHKRATSQLAWMNLKGKKYKEAFDWLQRVVKPVENQGFVSACMRLFRP